MPKQTKQLPEISYVQVLDEQGEVDYALEPSILSGDLVDMYRTMLLAREFDERRMRLQRQGRIGTFAPVKGQEAAQIGSIAALRDSDWLVPSYREMAAALWRGLRLEDDLLYTAGYEEGMVIPEDAHMLPICIPIASQCIHAVGVAWGARLKGLDEVAIVYFGDGATSEGDFHEAMNFAGVFEAPVIFFCQNNRFAISVPRDKQTRSETIAQKAVAYGIPALQVDGNDMLACYSATADAAERARSGGGPTFIEALTYRMSVHTTADDPTRYRSDEEVEEWERRDPIPRFRTYLIRKGLMSEQDHDVWVEEAREEVAEAVQRFEEMADGDPVDMFDFCTEERPPYLEQQRNEFLHGIVIDADGTVRPAEEEPREAGAGSTEEQRLEEREVEAKGEEAAPEAVGEAAEDAGERGDADEGDIGYGPDEGDGDRAEEGAEQASEEDEEREAAAVSSGDGEEDR